MDKRQEAIFAGTGGRGVLMAGQLLSKAGMHHYSHMVYFPSYGTEMRGGTSECTVILSDKAIGSPVLTQADVVMIFDISQLNDFEDRVKPGGLLILESSSLEQVQGVKRQDIRVINVSGIKMALEFGDIRVANLILLGTYIQATGALSPQFIEAELEKRLLERGQQALLSRNIEAFKLGLSAKQEH